MYMKKFADGGSAQQVTQFQPTFSPAQQGIGSLPYQAPDTPAMEGSPQNNMQYAPTTQYNAPAANPMTAGLGNYMQGLKYKPDASQTFIPLPRLIGAGGEGYSSGDDAGGGYGDGGGNDAGGGYNPATQTYGETTPTPTLYNQATQSYSDNPAFTAPVAPQAETGYFYDGEGNRRSVYDDDGNRRFNDDGTSLWGDGGDGDGEKAGGRIHAYAQGGSIPQGIASLGRGQDSMLVHMTPGEVQGLQRLAMAHGGSLTINPQTGLPEAGILSSLLPMALGFALGPAGFGLMSTSLGAAAAVGGIGALATGSLKKGLMAGLGAYGGSELGSSLTGMGAEQANALARPELAAASQAATTTGNAAADSALKFAEANKQTAIEDALATGRLVDDPAGYMGDDAYRASLTKNPLDNRLLYNTSRPTDFSTNPYSQEGIGYMQGQGSTGADIAQSARDYATSASPMPAYNEATQAALARGPAGNMFEGVSQLGSKEGLKTLGGKLGYAGMAGLAAPLISSAMQPAKFNPPARNPTLYARYGDGKTPGYTQPKYNTATGNYDPGFYGPESFYTNPTQSGAQGGAVGYKQGGIADFYPLTGDQVSVGPAPGGLGGRGEKQKYSRKISDPDSGAGIFNNKAGEGPYSDAGGIYENTPSGIESLFAKTSAATLARYMKAKSAPKQAAAIAELNKRATAVDDYGDDTASAAQGGMIGLNTYAAGGKLLRGPGDGMSDSIPAVINGARPQRAALADGEFVIPADVVSHLGNGSTEAGSKRLYSMMDKVRRARTGNPKQGKQINPDRFMPA